MVSGAIGLEEVLVVMVVWIGLDEVVVMVVWMASIRITSLAVARADRCWEAPEQGCPWGRPPVSITALQVIHNSNSDSNSNINHVVMAAAATSRLHLRRRRRRHFYPFIKFVSLLPPHKTCGAPGAWFRRQPQPRRMRKVGCHCIVFPSTSNSRMPWLLTMAIVIATVTVPVIIAVQRAP